MPAKPAVQRKLIKTAGTDEVLIIYEAYKITNNSPASLTKRHFDCVANEVHDSLFSSSYKICLHFEEQVPLIKEKYKKAENSKGKKK